MARPNFTVRLTAPLTTTISSGVPKTSHLESSMASEAVSGPARRRKPEGWVEPLPYSMTARRRSVSPDSLCQLWSTDRSGTEFKNRTREDRGNAYASGVGGSSTYSALDSTYTPQGVPQAFRDQALVKARIAMKNQDVNLGVAFAEADKTARMLGDNATRIAKAFRALRKGRWREAQRHLGLTASRRQPRGSNVTSQWLELQYGWKPLLNDVYGSVDALAKRDAHHWRVTGKGSRFESLDREVQVGSETNQHLSTGRGVVQGTRGVFVRIDAVPENDLTLALASLGITNPLEVAWELVPFSFVVDWALPVGNFLSSLDAMLGYGDTYCSISTLEKFSTVFTPTPMRTWQDGRYGRRVIARGKATESYVSLTRTVTRTVPLPSMPRLRDPRSLTRMANGLALLTQVFGRR